METETQFTRKKSGYIREFNVLDVFILNVLGYSIGLAVCTNPPFIAGFSPNAALWVVVLFGASLALVNGIAYGLFAGLMPNTGGDYHFVGRTLHHSLGFIANWGFTIANAFGLAFNLITFFTNGLSPLFLTVGYSFGNQTLIEWGKSVASPHMSLIFGSCLLGILVLLALSGRSLNRLFLYPLFVLALVGSALMWFVIHNHSQADFISSFNAFIQQTSGKSDAYQQTLQTAAANGLTPGQPSNLRAALHALPIAFLCFVGFNYSVYLGGEVRRPLRSQTIGIIFALLVGLVAFLALMGGYQNLVGKDFISALGIGGAVLEKSGIPSTSTSLFVGLMLPKGSYLNVIMQSCNILWFVSVPIVILQVCVRNVMAWSSDEMFFGAMLKRTKRTLQPWVAVLLVAGVAELWMLISVPFGLSLVGAATLLAVPSALTGSAAFFLPVRRKSFWNNAPPAIKAATIFGFSIFRLAGLLCFAGSGWLVWEAVKFDAATSPSGKLVTVWIYLAAVYGLGAVTYTIFWRRLVKTIPGGKEQAKIFRQELPSD